MGEEIKRWMPCLEIENQRVKPKRIVIMGRVAWKMPRFKGIKREMKKKNVAGL